MDLSGSEKVRAKREEVFDFVTDPRNFTSGIPDIKSVEVVGPDRFVVVAQLGGTSISAPFRIEFNVVEKQRPGHAKLEAHGRGAGSVVDMSITVDISEEHNGSTMDWRVHAVLGGLLASLGQRVLEPVAAKLTRGIFSRIRENLESTG